MKIQPAEGKIAIELMEEDAGTESDALLATVIGVGAEVKGIKEGDTVLVHNYVKDEVKIDSTTYVSGAYCVIGVVQE